MSKTKDKTIFLKNDMPIPGQNYVCLSFISPEKILKNKEMFFLLNFVKDRFDYKNNLNVLEEDYKTFLFHKQKELEKLFFEKNEFQTTVRGINVRGVFDTEIEAKTRSKSLNRIDPTHNIYVGRVGFWLPWDPNPNDLDQEYAQKELNTLMKNKKANEIKKNIHYEEEKRKRVDEAMKEGREPENFDEILFKNNPWQQKKERELVKKKLKEQNTKEQNTKEQNTKEQNTNNILNMAIKDLENDS